MDRYTSAGLFTLNLGVITLSFTLFFHESQQDKKVELLESKIEANSQILEENDQVLEENFQKLDEVQKNLHSALKEAKEYVLLHKEEAFEVWGHKDSILQEKEFTFRTLGKKEPFSVKGFEVETPQGESLYCFQPYGELQVFLTEESQDEIWTGSNVRKTSSWELKTMQTLTGTAIGKKDWCVELHWSE